MTSTLFQDFNERSKKVSKYFIFLKSLEQGSTKLSMKDLKGNSKIKTIDSELLKTLKANGFLLLYNLMEATMRNAIEAIFDELRSKGISYDQIRPELKKIVLKNLKRRNPDRLFASITLVSNDLAHGFKSFAEVGREKSADELVKIKNKVVRYLRQILQNIEQYLTHQEYLDIITPSMSTTSTP